MPRTSPARSSTQFSNANPNEKNSSWIIVKQGCSGINPSQAQGRKDRLEYISPSMRQVPDPICVRRSCRHGADLSLPISQHAYVRRERRCCSSSPTACGCTLRTFSLHVSRLCCLSASRRALLVQSLCPSFRLVPLEKLEIYPLSTGIVQWC